MIGSFLKNLKRFVVVSSLLYSSIQIMPGRCEESIYNMRIHKNFIKNILDKNFNVILEQIENKIQKDVFLNDINANMQILLKIQPKHDNLWEGIESDLFFDQGQIVLEVNNLEFVGIGQITDPKTQKVETISLQAPLDLAQLVLNLGQELKKDGNLYPKIDIQEVALTLDQKQFIVNAQGDLPLYKSAKFEASIKKWMLSQIQQREEDFKKELQKVEREIMSSFAFKKEIAFKAESHSSLSETIQLNDDFVVLQYTTEYQGKELGNVSKKMRKINPQFSNENQFMRDVQVVLDENYINYMLFSMFYDEKPFSLTETLLKYIPDTFIGAGAAIKALMNTQVWGFLLPDLARKYQNQRVDLKCGFNQDYLKKGLLHDTGISQVFFRDGNKVDLDLHFGCAFYVYDGPERKNEFEQLLDLFSSINNDFSDKNWKNYRSIFVSTKAEITFQFDDEAKTQKYNAGDLLKPVKMSEQMQFVFGKIYDFNPYVSEIVILNDGVEQKEEATDLKMRINEIKDKKYELQQNKILKPLFDFIFGNTIPLAPFPEIERCLGLYSKDSEMKIQEGYAIISYDFRVDQAGECLFDMNLKQNHTSFFMKEMRMAQNAYKEKGSFGQLDEEYINKFTQNLKEKIKILDPEFGKKHIADGISNLKNFAQDFDNNILKKLQINDPFKEMKNALNGKIDIFNLFQN